MKLSLLFATPPTVLFGIAGSLWAATILVPADQPSIQAAISAASNGDVVEVSAGTYNENINFMGKAIQVQSVGGAIATIIDGQELGPTVTFSSGEGNASVLSGFTITGGSNSTGEGAGISIRNSSPVITGNIITENSTCEGAGIGISFGSPIIQLNTITNNFQGGCSGGTGGGGILVGGSGAAQILSNLITDNSVNTADGGGISLFAAGKPVLTNNVISGNVVKGGSGGGIAMVNDSDAIIVQNLIVTNQANSGAGVAFSVPSGSTGPTLVNNTIVGNDSTMGLGSAVYASGFDDMSELFNNLLIGNASQNAVDCDTTYTSTPPIFQNNDVFAQSGSAFEGSCDVSATQSGNISEDPLLVDTAAHNYQLSGSSPAIDAGLNSAPDLPAKDFYGNPRIVAGKQGDAAIVDMGYAEFQPSAATPTPTPAPLGKPLRVTPGKINFAREVFAVEGTSSASRFATITNPASKGAGVTLGTPSVSGDFTIDTAAGNCGSSLAAAASCRIAVTFTPTALGTRTGTLTIADNAQGSPQHIVLQGEGVPGGLQISSRAINFGRVVLNSTTNESLSLSNPNAVALNISGISSSGPAFAVGQGCVGILLAGKSCSVMVTFTPTEAGAQRETIVIDDDALRAPQMVKVSGSAR
ncbi:MAG: choice-of-anchor D domain-containing protein [Candidatus Binataceae bacterium]